MDKNNRPRSRGLWVKLSVDYLDDPKILRAGALAEVLFVRGMAYAKKNNSGSIPDVSLIRIGIGLDDPQALAQRLCEVGLWEQTGDEYLIVGWGNWQTDQDEMDRRAEGGALGNHRRWHKTRAIAGCRFCDDDAIGSDSDSDSLDRIPEEEKEIEITNTLTGFDEFWDLYPRKVGKGDARKAWISARKARPDLEAVLSALRSAVAGWRGMEARFVPHPATWIRQERWSDEVQDTPSVVTAPVDRALENLKGEIVVFYRLRREDEDVWDHINGKDARYHDALHAYYDSLLDGSAEVVR